MAQVLAAYDVDLDVGLSAEQVDAAERLYGFNELASNPGARGCVELVFWGRGTSERP